MFDEYDSEESDLSADDAIQLEHARADWAAVVAAYEREARRG